LVERVRELTLGGSVRVEGGEIIVEWVDGPHNRINHMPPPQIMRAFARSKKVFY